MANKLFFEVGIGMPDKELKDIENKLDAFIKKYEGKMDFNIDLKDVGSSINELREAIGTGKPFSVLAKKAAKAQEAINGLSASLKNLGQTMTGNDKLNEFVSGLGNIIKSVNQNLKGISSGGSFKNVAKEVQESYKSVNAAEIQMAKLEALKRKMTDDASTARKLGVDTTDLDKAISKIEAIKSGLQAIRNGNGRNAEGLTTSQYMAKSDVQIGIMNAKQSLSDIGAKTREMQRLELQAQMTRASLNGTADAAGNVGRSLDSVLPSVSGFKKALAAVGGVYVFQRLAREIIEVRGEFQRMEVAITSLIGSEEKAAGLIRELKDYARISPLEVKDVMNASQTMIGFGVQTEKVTTFIKALGDVSLGNSERFKALALAFSQMSAAGRLMGQDLLQFINAGFNPLMYISEKTGKSIAELKDEMQKGAISTKMVEEAFIEATSAGGKFYQMSEKASQTIAGQMSKMHDSIDRALNKMGQDNEGIIMDSIKGITSLIDNYEAVGRVLMGLITSYGIHRTAVILATAAENGYSLALGIAKLRILATQKAQAFLNATMLSNPYVAAATALGVLVGVLIATSDGLSGAERAQKNFNDALEEAEESQRKFREETEAAINAVNDDATATDKQREALNLLINRYPSIIQKYIDEKGHLKDILQLKKEIALIDGNKAVADLTGKRDTAKGYAGAISRYRIARSQGREASAEDMRLYSEAVSLYLKENNLSRFGNVDPVKIQEYFDKQAGLYSQQAKREAAKNASKRFQDTITSMTDAQLESLQKTLQGVKGKKAVILKSYKDLENVTLNADDISSLLTFTGGIISGRKGKVRTKAVIEEDKKNAQAELEALSVAEANGKKGMELRKKIASYNKELEAYSASKTEKSENAAANAAVKAGEAAEKMTGERMKQTLEMARAAKDLELSTRAAEIGAMEEGTRKTIAQIELDKEQKMEAIKRSYEDLRQKRIEEAKKLWDADPKKKGTNFYESQAYKDAASDSRYTQAEKDNRIAREKEVEASAIREMEKAQSEKKRIMYDYLREYGSIQEKRKAINDDYNERIAKANDEWEAARLKAERDKLNSEVNLQELKMSIDWEDVFSDIDTHSVKFLEAIKSRLRAALDTKDITAENAKVLTEKIREIEKTIAGKTSVWQAILPGLQERKRLTEQTAAAEIEYQKALDEEAAAINQVIATKQTIKEHLDKLDIRNALGERITIELEAISEENKDNLLASLEKGSDLYNSLLKLFENLAADQSNLQGKQQTTTKKRSAVDIQWDKLKSMNKLTDVFSWAKGGNPLAILQGVNDNAQSLSAFVDKIGLANTDFGEAVHGFADGVGGFNNAVQALMNGDIFGAVNGVLDGIAGIGRMGINIIGGGNVDEMEAQIAELSRVNGLLSQSIESLAQSIRNQDSTNKQSEEAYKRALAAEKEWISNQQTAIKDRASEWSNSGHGFLGLGGKHSFNSYVNDRGRGWYGWQDFNRVLSQNGYKTQVNTAQDLWELSPEMMKLLRDYAPKAWAELLSSDGESNPSDLIEEYINNAGKIDELTSALNEKLTGYSWDAFKGSYVDLLKSLDSTNQDFADNLEDMLTNAILNALVNDVYKERISSIYRMISDAASEDSKGGTTMTQDELAEIRAANESLAADLIEARKNLMEAGIIKETQSSGGSSGSSMGSSIKGITEETAGILSSLVNGVRADTAVIRALAAQADSYWKDHIRMMTSSSQSLRDIESHTRAIMMSNEALMNSNQAILDRIDGLRNHAWKLPIA